MSGKVGKFMEAFSPPIAITLLFVLLPAIAFVDAPEPWNYIGYVAIGIFIAIFIAIVAGVLIYAWRMAFKDWREM